MRKFRRLLFNRYSVIGAIGIIVLVLMVYLYKPPILNQASQNSDVLGWQTYKQSGSPTATPITNTSNGSSESAYTNVPTKADTNALSQDTNDYSAPTSTIVFPTTAPTSPSHAVDPNIKIELCKSKSEQARQQAYDSTLAAYQKDHASTYALAQAINNDQTEKAALKYGVIKPSDVVRADVLFQQFIDSGATIDQARQWAQDGANNYWSYLETLHMQAKGEYDSYLGSIDAQAKNQANQTYSDCLSK